MDNIAEFVNADGTFVEGANLHTLAGEDYKESKALENVKNLEGLIKVAIDSKAEAKRKMDNYIARPGENASEEEINTFKNTLLTEAGMSRVAKPEDFEFNAPTDLPDGLLYDTELEKYYRNLFFEAGVPKQLAESIFNSETKRMIDAHIAETAEAKKAHDLEVADLKLRYPGEGLTEFARVAHNALMEFAGDDVVKDDETIKGLKTLIKEEKLYETPTDFDKWLKLGISVGQLEMWHKIGKKMQAGKLETNDRVKKTEVSADVAFINKVNAQTPEFQMKE